jgi:hypothetical protein
LVDKDAKPLTIHLSYPSTIKPLKVKGCKILAAKNADGSDVYGGFNEDDCEQ